MYIFYSLDPKTAEKIEKARFVPPDNWSGDYQDVKDILETKHRWGVLNGKRFDFDNPKHIKMLPDIIGGVYVWCEKRTVVSKARPENEIIIDSEEDDDWMKSLPGYEDEIKLHEELASKL